MKKIIAFILLLTVMVSCYDDYIQDFDHDGIYFTYQNNVRSLIVGEGMKIEIGVVLAGIRENDRDRIIEFQIIDTLPSAATLEAMKGGFSYVRDAVASLDTLLRIPSSYYTLSHNSQIVIEQGQHSGSITLQADSAVFLADTATLMAKYILPLAITSADADTVLESKNYTEIGLKYENMLFGNYWHGGVTTVRDPGGAVIDEIIYYTSIPSPDGLAWNLKTVGPASLSVNGVSDLSSTGREEFILTLNGDNIVVSSSPAGLYEVKPDGASTFNRSRLLQDRMIYLNYQYEDAVGNSYHASDTLKFRNRIRDGVNEWQDENPGHYN